MRVLVSACAAALLLSGCGMLVMRGARHMIGVYNSPEYAVDAALARYAGFVVRMEAEQAAALFEPNGELLGEPGGPAVGREAITALFRSPANARIVEYEIRATSTTVQGDTARQRGDYRQVVAPPAGGAPAVRQGVFDAAWSRQGDGRWLLLRLRQAPVGTRLAE